MKSNKQNESKREPARYSVHTDSSRGIEKIGIGGSLAAEIAFAKRYHGATGQKTWVRDGLGSVVHQIERGYRPHAEASKTARAATVSQGGTSCR